MIQVTTKEFEELVNSLNTEELQDKIKEALTKKGVQFKHISPEIITKAGIRAILKSAIIKHTTEKIFEIHEEEKLFKRQYCIYWLSPQRELHSDDSYMTLGSNWANFDTYQEAEDEIKSMDLSDRDFLTILPIYSGLK